MFLLMIFFAVIFKDGIDAGVELVKDFFEVIFT